MADLVDGNNLLGRLGGSDPEDLVRELVELARRKRKRLTVVFDGPPPPGRAKVSSLGDVTIVAAAPLSADEEILRRIREHRDPGGLTVVTDDRVLAGSARACGARTCGLEAFQGDARRRMSAAAPGAPVKPVLPGGAKEWERWFSDPKNRLT